MPAVTSSVLALGPVQPAVPSGRPTSPRLRLLRQEPPPRARRASEAVRLPDQLGVLTAACPPELVDAVLAECGCVEKRRRRLPARLLVYSVLAMCLFPWASYEEVLRLLSSGWPLPPEWRLPNKSSISRGRERLGWQVMARLFAAIAGPLAGENTSGAFWRGLRPMAADSMVLEVPDTPANEAAFGGQTGAGGIRVGHPLMRVAGLAECGTHALVDAEFGAYQDAEVGLVAKLARSLRPGMLVMVDRGLIAVELWRVFTSAGAHLLWRAQEGMASRVLRCLPDGSYLSQLRPSGKRRWPAGQRPQPVTVRIVEYSLEGSDTVYRLLTDLLDPATAPAQELAALYHQRWEIEGVFKELKTHQRGPAAILRSRSPDGARQEVWAHLIVHHATRQLMHQASAATKHRDPDRISFTRTLNIVRRSVTAGVAFSPSESPQGHRDSRW
jgi:hypothetical protein